MIIDVAKVKRDLRLDGCNPENVKSPNYKDGITKFTTQEFLVIITFQCNEVS